MKTYVSFRLTVPFHVQQCLQQMNNLFTPETILIRKSRLQFAQKGYPELLKRKLHTCIPVKPCVNQLCRDNQNQQTYLYVFNSFIDASYRGETIYTRNTFTENTTNSLWNDTFFSHHLQSYQLRPRNRPFPLRDRLLVVIYMCHLHKD